MINRKQISKAIKEQFNLDIIVEGNRMGEGCYYFRSDDLKTSDQLLRKSDNVVFVNSLNQLTIEQWVSDFKNIWESD